VVAAVVVVASAAAAAANAVAASAAAAAVIAAVAAGGALGSVARYWLSTWLRSAVPGFPWGTLAVNVVGGFAMGAKLHETPIEDFEAIIRLNLRPAYLVTAAALPHLVAADGGSIVFVSSRAAVAPFPGAAGYITAKAAVLALADAVAVEYKKQGVRANTVLPSVIDTPGNRAGQPGANTTNWVTPEQIAKVIAFLAGDDSAPTSGAHIPVYGQS